MSRLILLRHGESEWNRKNLFTGWTDVDLSEKGREEAAEAGRRLKAAGIKPEFYFTSYLKRAIHTLEIASDAMDRDWVTVVKDWHLNERHYGALQGMDKDVARERYGEDQVHIWRRSYDVIPPALERTDPRYSGSEEKYVSLSAGEIPVAESLEMVSVRVKACWSERILPALRLFGTVLVVAHGNSLRALAMSLLGLSPEQVVSLEIPTGRPWIFDLDKDTAVEKNYYL